MTQEELKVKLIKDVCLLENKCGCHEVRINKISVYHFIRREIRIQYLGQKGYDYIEKQAKGSIRERIKSVLKSIKHLFVMPANIPILFRTFRIEDINGLRMDRFIDPIIEECNIKDNYVIFETNNGRIFKNRCHSEHVYFDDCFSFVTLLLKSFMSLYYRLKYKEEFGNLFNSISEFIPIETIDEKFIVNRIITCLIRVSLYKFFLSRKNVKVVIAASRSSFMPLTCAAKILGVKVYELQHGIIYGETITYSGYRDSLFVPDKFLLFGDVHPQDVYGTDGKDLKILGWALMSYVKKLNLNTNISKNDILVLSQQQSTDYIIDTMLFLAENNKDVNFYLRCHPMETLKPSHMEAIKRHPNVYIQDNKMSLIIALAHFDKVIGDKSTAIYEALSYGKRTGILTMNDHKAVFLQEKDADFFWIIKDNSAFVDFVKSEKNERNTLSIYSPFNRSMYDSLIKECFVKQ